MYYHLRKLAVIVGVIFVYLLAMNAQAGQIARSQRNPGFAQPHSNAFGRSLDEWMGIYLEWLADGADPDARVKNVGFLPIIGTSPFEVEVESGTALVLPVFTRPAYTEQTDRLPDELFGDPDHIFGEVQLDDKPILEVNENYYVGPTYFDPPLYWPSVDKVIYYYQALVCVINPLPPGDHKIVLHSEFKDLGKVYNNIWIINVVPGKGQQ